ncbi:MAG: CoA-binding protein [Bifidobacteriaceae bacterium]|nr:CoA-binding protein [Bifidobacteriaceae bacterium]
MAGPGAVGGGDGIGGAEGRRSALSSGPWQPPDAAERYEILAAARTVALVGASPNPSRSSFFVATYLLSSTPYEVFFVNPRASEILGRPVYPALADLPVKPDIVDVFRRHDDLPGVAREAVAADARVLWLQLGSWHEEAAELATRAGLKVVMDRCLKIEHARFHGGLHLAGFDTGVISSRRALVAGPARPTEPGRGSR